MEAGYPGPREEGGVPDPWGPSEEGPWAWCRSPAPPCRGAQEDPEPRLQRDVQFSLAGRLAQQTALQPPMTLTALRHDHRPGGAGQPPGAGPAASTAQAVEGIVEGGLGQWLLHSSQGPRSPACPLCPPTTSSTSQLLGPGIVFNFILHRKILQMYKQERRMVSNGLPLPFCT